MLILFSHDSYPGGIFVYTVKVNMTWPIPDFVLLTLMLQIPSENKVFEP